MYCSGCGQILAPGQPLCPHCGRPAAAPVPSVPGLQFQLEGYSSKIKALGIFWFIYAGFSLLFGILGLAFANAFFSGRLGSWGRGPWAHGPWMQSPGGPPLWLGPTLLHFAWIWLIARSGLAIAATWGLLERAPWGRIVAVVAAIFALLKFPFGTALGIWTLILLLGYRNTTLYKQL